MPRLMILAGTPALHTRFAESATDQRSDSHHGFWMQHRPLRTVTSRLILTRSAILILREQLTRFPHQESSFSKRA